ncbi:MAG TPA: flippase activity-associated protein Agl23, partial [Verrucomicrobium sp.]|nr:flippase activity-associated protein Agl23 [Verrucomicrobium sp.]
MAREPAPLNWKTFILLLILALGLGSLYRFTDLGKKPMHTDEAILALKTQEYAGTHTFEYDPKDYHGPFLHHAATWLSGAKGWDATKLNEEQLRWIVAVFGLALVLLPLLFIDALGRTGAVVAALLAAASPMLTYYSRYYIMEVPFVFLVGLFIGSLWRWSQKRNALWLLVAGLCLGFMHATKETFVLNMAAMAAAWALTSIQVGSFEPRNARLSYAGSRPTIPDWMAWTIVAAIAAITSVWMFSNGFKDWKGVQDSVATYESYLRRSGGSGHEKPWHYYIMLLSWRKDGFVWSEGLVMGLGVVGILDTLIDRRRPVHQRAFLTFLSLYSVVLLAIYSIIPYKTPWSIMAVQYGFVLLAGVGMRRLFRSIQLPFFKTILVILFGAGIYHLCSQSNFATDYSFPGINRYAADPRNPYVYSHTSTNVLELSKRIHELAAVKLEEKENSIQVIQSEQGWPLPWYLRDLANVGYQATIPAKLAASIIVTDADNESAVKARLEGEYESSPYGLRPGVLLSLMVEKDLWEAYLHPEKAQEKARPLVEKAPEPAGPASIPVTPPGGIEGSGHLAPFPASPVQPSVSVPAGRAGSLPFTSTFATPAAPTLGDAPVRK